MSSGSRNPYAAWVVAGVLLAVALAFADLFRPSAWDVVAFLVLPLAPIAIALRRAPSSRDGASVPDAPGTLAPTPTRWMLLRQGLRMGVTAFGGALAVVAQAERELVQRLRWVSPGTFAEAAAFGQSLPGAIANNAMSLLGFGLRGSTGPLLLHRAYLLP